MRLEKTNNSQRVVFKDLIRYNDYKSYSEKVVFEDKDVYDVYPSRFNYYFAYDINKKSIVLVQSSVRDIKDIILDSFFTIGEDLSTSLSQIKNYNEYVINYVNSNFGIDLRTDKDYELVDRRFNIIEQMNTSLSVYEHYKDNYNNASHEYIVEKERELQILGSAYMLLNARMDVLGY